MQAFIGAEHGEWQVIQLPAFKDNYLYLLANQKTQEALAIDPGDAETILEYLKDHSLKLMAILNTHHHADHVGGNAKLKARFGIKVYGPHDDRITGIDHMLFHGRDLEIMGTHAQVLSVPGHTSSHIAFWFSKQGWLFVGDTLFGLGCGRLFEGSPEQMWQSLKLLRALPESTLVFCAHEYTLANGRFAQSLRWMPEAFPNYLKSLEVLWQTESRTVPSSLADEIKFNPFLLSDHPKMQAAYGAPNDSSPEFTFAALRELKNHF